MKVIAKGDGRIGWQEETVCSGAGNGKKGCGAVLEVTEDDLYQTSRHSYGDTHPDYFNTFECCECGNETDMPDSSVPSEVRNNLKPKVKPRHGSTGQISAHGR